MRVFKKYLPLMVAKHVKTFYQGVVYIQDCGHLEFRNGRLLMPSFQHYSAELSLDTICLLRDRVAEVNNLIKQMMQDAA